MNTKILSFGTREAVKHPQGALRVSAAAIRYRRAILAGMGAARQASKYGARP